jgi:hypothetical protein
VTEAETVRTRTLARVVGPYMIVMGLTIATRVSTMQFMLPAFMQDGPLVLAAGCFTLMVGLTILAAHHHWSSPAAIVITVVGIAAALKGAWLMLFPQAGDALTAAVVRTPPLLLIVAVLMALVGAWLSFVGWFAKGPARV